jgi:hypothetical protein
MVGGGYRGTGHVEMLSGDPVREVGGGEAMSRLAQVGPVIREDIRGLVSRDADVGRDPVNADSPVGFGFPKEGTDSADQKNVATGNPTILQKEGGIATVGENVQGMAFGRVLQKGVDGHADGKEFANVVGTLAEGRCGINKGSATVAKGHLKV